MVAEGNRVMNICSPDGFEYAAILDCQSPEAPLDAPQPTR